MSPKLTGDYETDVNLLVAENLSLKSRMNEEATKLNKITAKIAQQTFKIWDGDMDALTAISMRMWAIGNNLNEEDIPDVRK